MSRKLKEEDENPIDNLAYKVVEILDPIFYKLKFTPNIITTLSMLFGILSIYYFIKKNYICIPLYVISYILDCSDGYYARKYNMVTKFGDYYDHISDILVQFILLYLIYIKTKVRYKIQLIITIIIFNVLMSYHMALQELIYNKAHESEWLNLYIKNFISNLNKDNIRWSRYFGCGTYNLVIVIIMYLSINGKI